MHLQSLKFIYLWDGEAEWVPAPSGGRWLLLKALSGEGASFRFTPPARWRGAPESRTKGQRPHALGKCSFPRLFVLEAPAIPPPPRLLAPCRELRLHCCWGRDSNALHHPSPQILPLGVCRKGCEMSSQVMLLLVTRAAPNSSGSSCNPGRVTFEPAAGRATLEPADECP